MNSTIIKPNNIVVHGLNVNSTSGCEHYHSELDIIAIKFKCCGLYWACCVCHQNGNTNTKANHPTANHAIERWEHHEFNTMAILCGCCGIELTINQYLNCNSFCPNCNAAFNSRCRLHWHQYFDLDPTPAYLGGDTCSK
jgi:uncharacterized CHY-type Zn-finger protein